MKFSKWILYESLCFSKEVSRNNLIIFWRRSWFFSLFIYPKMEVWMRVAENFSLIFSFFFSCLSSSTSFSFSFFFSFSCFIFSNVESFLASTYTLRSARCDIKNVRHVKGNNSGRHFILSLRLVSAIGTITNPFAKQEQWNERVMCSYFLFSTLVTLVVILFYIFDKLNGIMWHQIFRSERKLHLKNFRMQQQICPTVFRLNVIQ